MNYKKKELEELLNIKNLVNICIERNIDPANIVLNKECTKRIPKRILDKIKREIYIKMCDPVFTSKTGHLYFYTWNTLNNSHE